MGAPRPTLAPLRVKTRLGVGRGIRVNAVSPGVIQTPEHAPETYAGLAALHPLARVGQVSDVVDGILYLESAPFVTGEILHIDGARSRAADLSDDCAIDTVPSDRNRSGRVGPQVQHEVDGRLRRADEELVVTGRFERWCLVRRRAGQDSSDTGVTDAGTTRPPRRYIVRLGQLEH